MASNLIYIESGALKGEFENRPAAIPIDDLRKWFGEQKWENATHNRYKTTLSLIFRLGVENGKVQLNPAKLLKHKTEDNERVRFLNQFKPAETKLEYLKPCLDEESRLRAVIMQHYADHIPEFEIALHTGMRPSEQYGLDWTRVDLERNYVSLQKTKNGKARHTRLNAVAVAAFKVLKKRCLNGKGEVFVNIEGMPLYGYKHCLRHTFASRLAMAGVDLLTISESMGHKAIQMTKRYAHLAPAHNQAAVDRLVTFQSESSSEEASATSHQALEAVEPAEVQ